MKQVRSFQARSSRLENEPIRVLGYKDHRKKQALKRIDENKGLGFDSVVVMNSEMMMMKKDTGD